MQLFREDTKISIKNVLSKIARISNIRYSPVHNFQYCQLAPNQPKSHILFHKNDSPRDLYRMTLVCMHELMQQEMLIPVDR